MRLCGLQKAPMLCSRYRKGDISVLIKGRGFWNS